MGTPRKKKRYPTTTVDKQRNDAVNTGVAPPLRELQPNKSANGLGAEACFQSHEGLEKNEELTHSSASTPIKFVRDSRMTISHATSSKGQFSQTPRNLRGVRTLEREKRNLVMALVFITIGACVHSWNLMLAFSLLSFGGFFLNAYFRAPKEEIQNRVVDLVEDGALETNAQAQTVDSVLRHSHLKNPGPNPKKLSTPKGLKLSE